MIKAAWKGIVKIQRPLGTNAPKPLILVYNQDQSIREQFESTPHIDKMFGNEYKVYVYAELVDGVLNLGAPVHGVYDW